MQQLLYCYIIIIILHYNNYCIPWHGVELEICDDTVGSYGMIYMSYKKDAKVFLKCDHAVGVNIWCKIE